MIRALERARAGAAERSTARVLGVAIGAPVMHVRRTALTFGDRPVEYRHSIIDTAQHDYVNLLTRPAPPASDSQPWHGTGAAEGTAQPSARAAPLP